MKNASPRVSNWVLTIALAVMSVALALFGILGWAWLAGAFDDDVAALDPLWPLYAMAAVACVAAQVIAACAVVNFARLSSAGAVWRFLAIAFYGVAVLFAAYSADKGAQVILSSAHHAAYEARESERAALVGEIAELTQVIRTERDRMSAPGTVGPQTRAAETSAFEVATAVERARLPLAQSALDARPSLPREAAIGWGQAVVVFLIFLAWALLEPWGYALAERGRAIDVPRETPFSEPQIAPANDSARTEKHPWLMRLASGFAALLLSQGPTPALASESHTGAGATPDPILLAATRGARDMAFALRGKERVEEIAARIGVHPATIWRWYAKRDAELKKLAGVA